MRKHGRFYELEFLQFVQSLNLGGTYVDIGANIGNHSVWLANFCDCERIISIEGHPEIFETLSINCETNITKDFCLINRAITDGPGEVTFAPINANNVGGSHVLQEGVQAIDDGLPFKALSEATTVPADALDNLLADESEITFMKLDIEGCETKAMAGATNILQTHRPVFSVEFWHEDELAEFAKTVSALGYQHIAKFGNNTVWQC